MATAAAVGLVLITGVAGCGPSGEITQEQESPSVSETTVDPGPGASEQPGTTNTPEVGDGQNEDNTGEGG